MTKQQYKLSIEAWNQWKDNFNEWVVCSNCKKKMKTFRLHNDGKYCFHCSLWYFQEIEEGEYNE